jgi:hypothetical protein
VLLWVLFVNGIIEQFRPLPLVLNPSVQFSEESQIGSKAMAGGGTSRERNSQEGTVGAPGRKAAATANAACRLRGMSGRCGRCGEQRWTAVEGGEVPRVFLDHPACWAAALSAGRVVAALSRRCRDQPSRRIFRRPLRERAHKHTFASSLLSLKRLRCVRVLVRRAGTLVKRWLRPTAAFLATLSAAVLVASFAGTAVSFSFAPRSLHGFTFFPVPESPADRLRRAKCLACVLLTAEGMCGRSTVPSSLVRSTV